MRLLVSIVLVGLIVAVSVGFYAFDSDAAFAVHDAIWYGAGAESFPAGSINPHHPLFHVLAIVQLPLLRALGVPHPGHVATRVVSGLGAAWILLQVCALAGRRRVLVGAAFAALLFCMRGLIVEMATGENVLPAAAAALFALTLATRPDAGLLATGAALTLALLLRQDNVFLAPAVAIAVALRLPRGSRIAGLARLGAGVAVATAAGYLAAYYVAHGQGEDLREWMMRFGLEGPWTGPKGFEWGRVSMHLFHVAVAITGRLGPPGEDPAILGLGYLAAILVPGVLLRGSSPNLALAAPFLITIAGRTFFFSWYEADNFEWVLLPIILVVAQAAALARGEPVAGKPARRLAILLMTALGGWAAFAHASSTWKLRERNLISAIEEAVQVDRSQWRFLSTGARVSAGYYLLGIPPAAPGGPETGVYADLSSRSGDGFELFRRLDRERELHPVPTIILADRFVLEGMPYTIDSQGGWAIDSMELPGWTLIRRGGLAYGGRWVPDVAATRDRGAPPK